MRQFVTNVGLITSAGPVGDNIMAAEWTRHVSYSPSLIMINLKNEDATISNILKTKQFGVNLASQKQGFISSIAGSASGRNTDKIAALKELGAEFYPGRKIKAPMLASAAMNAECKLVKKLQLGDHLVLVGEVVELNADENKIPLLYHNGKYWKLGEEMQSPSTEQRAETNAVVKKHTK